MKPALPALLVLLSGSGCTTRAIQGVVLPEENFQLGFIILFDSTGAPKSLSAPFSRERAGELPPLELAPGEDAAALILISAETIAALEPGFVPAAASEARLELSSGGPLPQTFTEGAKWRTELALPAQASLYRVHIGGDGTEVSRFDPGAPEAEALRMKLALVLPIDPEPCGDPLRPQLQAFAQHVDEPLRYDSNQNQFGTVYSMQVLDDRTVLAMVPGAIFQLERGQPFDTTPVREGSPGKLLLATDVPGPHPGAGFNRIMIPPMTLPSGEKRVFLLATGAHTGESGLVMELTATAQGLVYRRSAATGGVGFVDGDLSESGDLVIVDFNGALYVWTGDGLLERRFPAIATENSYNHRVLWTGDADHPLLVGVPGALLLLDRATGTFELQPMQGQRKPFLAAELAKRTGPGGATELWAAGTEGRIVRRTIGGPWTPVSPSLPPSFAGCAAGEYPHLRLEEDLNAMKLTGDELYLTVRECSAFLRMRISDACTTWFGAGDAAGTTSDELLGIDVQPGIIATAGEHARVLAIFPP